jgi:thymidine kinase
MQKYKAAIIAHIGPMFGGKTSALLSDIKKMEIAGFKVALFKPTKDNRYSNEEVVNHDGEKCKSINIKSISDILNYILINKDINVIAVDEFQFLKDDKYTSKELIEKLIEQLIISEKTLIVSGLDLDSNFKPFDNIKELLPYCTHIFKHKAVCMNCGNDATISYCKVKKISKELIGGADIYEPLCIHCYREKIINNLL